MGIRKYKPTTPGRRGSSVADFVELTRSTPEKSLLVPSPKTGGRNNSGKITTRHIGGGHKQAYRLVDFKRYDKDGVPAKVAAHRVRPEPHRPDRPAALRRRREALHHRAARVCGQGAQVDAGPTADIKPGNNLPLRNIPVGTTVHAVELRPGGGAKIARSAGASVQLVAREGANATLRMPSGRDAAGRRPLPRHGGRGRQRRAVQHQLGQGRPQPLEGQAPDRPRRGHEPDRPPARWW